MTRRYNSNSNNGSTQSVATNTRARGAFRVSFFYFCPVKIVFPVVDDDEYIWSLRYVESMAYLYTFISVSDDICLFAFSLPLSFVLLAISFLLLGFDKCES